MHDVLFSLLAGLASSLRTRASLQFEILALRHQLGVLQRTERRRLRLVTSDRFLWVVLFRFWSNWRGALVIVKPGTVIGWHPKGFRFYWNWKSRRRISRPGIPKRIRELIREMSGAKVLWGVIDVNHFFLSISSAKYYTRAVKTS